MYLATNVFSLVDPAAATDLLDLAHVVEEVGFDELDLGDHVTIGRPAPGRRMPGPPAAALLEPLVALGAVAAVTRRIRLGTGVLILPQRQPALVAKQVATLDRLSNGRVRLAVGVGWQAPEYEVARRPLRRARTADGRSDRAAALVLDPALGDVPRPLRPRRGDGGGPPPVQPGGPPVWLGGGAEAALRRVGRVADGWLAVGEDPRSISSKVSVITRAAQDAGRDPRSIGLHVLLGESSDLDRLAAEASAFRAAGFSGASVNLDHVIASGARDLDRQRHTLARIRSVSTRRRARTRRPPGRPRPPRRAGPGGRWPGRRQVVAQGAERDPVPVGIALGPPPLDSARASFQRWTSATSLTAAPRARASPRGRTRSPPRLTSRRVRRRESASGCARRR